MRSFSIAELSNLLSAARAYRRRDWLTIPMPFCHGLRASEVIAIAVNNLRDAYLTVASAGAYLRVTDDQSAEAVMAALGATRQT
jgi:integrase